MSTEIEYGIRINVEGTRPSADAIGQVRKATAELSETARDAGQSVAAGYTQAGAATEAAARKSTSATQSMIAQIQRTTAAMEAGSRTNSAYYTALARERGLDAEALKPYLAQLDTATARQKALQGATRSATAEMASARSEIKASDSAVKQLGMTSKQTAAAMRGVPAQFTDIFTSLQGGQSPLTVFLQQGGQLKDMFGGAGNAARAMGSYIVGLINPLTLAAAAVGVLTIAYYQGSNEATAYNRALIMTGNIAGTTAGRLSDVANRVSNVVGTQHAAAEAVTALVSVGITGERRLENLAIAAVAMEKSVGKSVSDTVKEFAELGQSPVDASIKLNQQYHYLTEATYARIKSLQDQGRTEEAAAAAQDALGTAFEARAKKIKENLGSIEGAWAEATAAAAKYWDNILDVGREKDDDAKLKYVQGRLAIEERKLAERRARTGVKDDDVTRGIEALIAKTREELSGLQAAEDAKLRANKAEEDGVRLREAKIRWDQQGEQYLTRAVRREREIDAVRTAGLAAKATEAQIEGRIAQVRAKYADKGPNQVEKEGDLLASLTGVTADYTQQLNLLQGARARLKMSDERYVELMTELIAKQPAAKKLMEEQAKADKERADLSAKADDAVNKEIGSINEQTRALEEKIKTYGMLPAQVTAARIAELEASRESLALSEAGRADIDAKIEALKRLQAAQGKSQALEVDVTQAREMLDIVSQVDEVAQSAAKGMADAFGHVGSAIGSLTTVITGNARAQRAIFAQQEAAIKAAGNDQAKIYKANAQAAQQSAQAQVRSYGDMAGAAKSFFNENSAGYRAMEAVEKGFRAIEMAMAIENMVAKSGLVTQFTALFTASKAQETAATVQSVAPDVAATMAKGQAAAVAGVANQAQGDPYTAWGRMAAMAAVMAALGFAVSGVGGRSDTTAKDRQAAAGTGSVLGDASAKSESIAKATDLIAENSAIQIDYLAGMRGSLRNIEMSIGGLGRTVSTSGVMDGVLTPASAKALIALAIGKGSVVDSGIVANAGQLGAIANSGIQAQRYQETKVDGGWFHSDKYYTDYAALAPELTAQFTQVIRDIAGGVRSAADMLGMGGDAFSQRLDQFVVNVGKISLKDLKPEEVQEQLEAVFSKVADDMAEFGVAGLSQFQRVGEGYFETLTRVASNYANLDSIMKSIGDTFGATGAASIAARERFIELNGGIDKLASQTRSFAESFLTDEERLAPVRQYVTEQMAQMGKASIRTKDQFKAAVLDLVNSGALAAEAGAKQYAALMAIAPLFAEVMEGIEQNTREKRDALADAYRNEVDALSEARAGHMEFARSLRSLKDSSNLGNLSVLSPMEKYAEARAQFDSVVTAIRAGDESARGRFNDAYTNFLTQSQVVNATDATYHGDKVYADAIIDELAAWADGQVDVAQASLDVLREQVSGLIDIKEEVTTVAQAIADLKAAIALPGSPAPSAAAIALALPSIASAPDAVAGTAGGAAIEPLVEELRYLRAERQASREKEAALVEQLELLRAEVANQTDEVVGATHDAAENTADRIEEMGRTSTLFGGKEVPLV